MTGEDIKKIADEAAEAAVNKLLLRLGVDPESDTDIPNLKKNLAHLQAWREATSIVKTSGLRAAATVIVTGLLGALWLIWQSGRG